MSFAVYFVLLLYASHKLDRLLNRTNPSISSFHEYEVRSRDEVVNLADIQFKFAFAVEGFRDRELKDSTSLLKGIARLRGQKSGKHYDKIIPYHKCTDSDWDHFPPPAQSA